MTFRLSTLAFAAAALIAGPIAAAHAQTEAPQAPSTMEAPAAAPTASYDDGKLQSFVVAFLQVDQINRTYAPQLAAAGSEEEQQQVRQQAGEAMVGAVENSCGITVEEYNQIIETAQGNPELAQQINTMIQEAAKAPAEPAPPAE